MISNGKDELIEWRKILEMQSEQLQRIMLSQLLCSIDMKSDRR